MAAHRGRTTQRLPPQPLPLVPLLLLEIEERGTANARRRLRQLLHLMYMRRRKCWVRERVSKIEALIVGGPRAGGDKWRASLFGPAYSSDNAGDGPKVRNGVSPTLSDRDKRSMMSHIKGARIHNSDATQCEWIIPNQHQFARKLAEYRAYQAARLTTRRCSLERYII